MYSRQDVLVNEYEDSPRMTGICRPQRMMPKKSVLERIYPLARDKVVTSVLKH
jgi:hypothetical protein